MANSTPHSKTQQKLLPVWADNAGLKHHCPVCATPLNSEKAKNTCVGTHVEWCGRYHSLHRRSSSKNCTACKNIEELHDKRHREIAELVNKIRNFKFNEDDTTTVPASSTPRPLLTPLTLNNLYIADCTVSTNDTSPRMNKKARKAAKKAFRAFGHDKVVTTAEVEAVTKTLHLDGCSRALDQFDFRELADKLEKRLSLSYEVHLVKSYKNRRDSMVQEEGTKEQIGEVEMGRILAALGIETKVDGKLRELVDEAREAVRKDLVAFCAETRANAERKDAFWRWARKRARNDLEANGGDWDTHKDGKERTPVIKYWPQEASGDGGGSELGEWESDEGFQPVMGEVEESVGSWNADSSSSSVSSPEPVGDVSLFAELGKKPVKKLPVAGKVTFEMNGGLHHFGKQQVRKPVWGRCNTSSFEDTL